MNKYREHVDRRRESWVKRMLGIKRPSMDHPPAGMSAETIGLEPGPNFQPPDMTGEVEEDLDPLSVKALEAFARYAAKGPQKGVFNCHHVLGITPSDLRYKDYMRFMCAQCGLVFWVYREGWRLKTTGLDPENLVKIGNCPMHEQEKSVREAKMRWGIEHTYRRLWEYPEPATRREGTYPWSGMTSSVSDS